MKANIAVKNTVAPIPAYLFCSPLEQPFTMSWSAPEHRIKKVFSILIDLATEISSVGGLTIRVSAIVKPKVTKCLYVLVIESYE